MFKSKVHINHSPQQRVELKVVVYFKIKHNIYLIWSLVSSSMAWEVPLRFLCFLALVALEWYLRHVCFYVIFQSARFGGSKVALVTSERSFSCVLLHNVDFQITSFGARKLAHCASMWLFTRVRLQVACCCCSIFALIAIKQFFPSVPLDMRLEGGSSVAGEVALCAPVRFLPDVKKRI